MQRLRGKPLGARDLRAVVRRVSLLPRDDRECERDQERHRDGAEHEPLPPRSGTPAGEDVPLLELGRHRLLGRVRREVLLGQLEIAPTQEQAAVLAGVPVDRAHEQSRVRPRPLEIRVERARELGECGVAVVALSAPDPVQLAQAERRGCQDRLRRMRSGRCACPAPGHDGTPSCSTRRRGSWSRRRRRSSLRRRCCRRCPAPTRRPPGCPPSPPRRSSRRIRGTRAAPGRRRCPRASRRRRRRSWAIRRRRSRRDRAAGELPAVH